jgi:hypothetical protein
MLQLVTLLILVCLPSWSWAVGVLAPAAGDATFMVAERAVESSTAVMVNANTVFTISGGPIQIVDLVSICVTANDGTASTMQWQSVPTVGTATTFSGASASLASATAGTTVRLAPTALSTAPVIVAAASGGVQLGTNVANHIDVKDGTLKLVIGVGSTTGTWKHILRYKPLSPSSTVN